MNVYGAEQTRNAVLLGHRDAGKTTVAEVLALLTGATKCVSKVPDGNTISDYNRKRVKRQLSISITLIPLEYGGKDGPIEISLLDTPGFFDFVGEIEEAIGVADAAIIVISCKAGTESGTERAREMYEKCNLPRLIFVTNMDDDHASYHELVVKLETEFGCKIASSQLLTRESEKFVSSINVVRMGGHRLTNLSDYEEREIPGYIQKNLTTARDALIEAVAETSEEYMERYFLGGGFTQEEISAALRTHVVEGDIVLVMMGPDISCQGFKVSLQAIDKYFPLPDHFKCIGVDVSTGERFTAKYSDGMSLSVRVFKTIVDLFTGRYSLMKICTGALKDDTAVYNVDKDTEGKIGKLYILRGKGQIEVQELRAGDIGAVAKLTVAQTGGIVAVHTAPIVHHKPQTPIPYTYMVYKAASKGEDDKVFTALAEVMEEDLTLKVVNDAEDRQAPLYGIGDQQLGVVINKLQSCHKVDVILSPPRFAFRKTLRKKVKVQGKHKKQSGGHGQYGDIVIEFEPSDDLETPYTFEEKIFGGPVPGNYFPAVEKGPQECIPKGPLAGYPVMSLKAILLSGSYHLADSSEMALKMATILVFKQGFVEANPVLPEPIAPLRVTVPDKFTGDVMSDLNRRRGRILDMNSDHSGKQAIEADVPIPELFGCNTDLRSMTGGLGDYSYEFSRCGQAPGNVQKHETEAKAAVKDGE